MQSTRLVGPSSLYWITSTVVVAITVADLAIIRSAGSFLWAGLAALFIWRALGVGVFLEGDQLVVRNTTKTLRFQLGDVDIQPVVTDSPIDSTDREGSDGQPELSKAAEDNKQRVATRYVLTVGEDHHQIDALMGRTATSHERLAGELRQAIIREAGRDLT